MSHLTHYTEVSKWCPSSSRLITQRQPTWTTRPIGCIWYYGSPHPYQPAPVDVQHSQHSLELDHIYY